MESIRGRLAAAPALADVVISGALLVAVLTLLSVAAHTATVSWAVLAVGAVLLLLLTGSAVVTRWTPTGAGVLALAAYAPYALLALPPDAVELPLCAGLWFAGLRGGWRVVARLVGPCVLVGAAVGAITTHSGRANAVTAAAVLAVLVSLPLLGGGVARHLREDVQRERQRAERLARLADLERAAGVAQERARIARELHDIVAHRLSAITVQAHAGEHLVAVDAASAGRAFAAVAEEATQGLVEMHGLLSLLRQSDAAAGTPGLDDIADLIAAERATGTNVTWHPPGPGAPDDVAAEVTLAAYRVVQESLSNVRRHAPGAAVAVHARIQAATGDVGHGRLLVVDVENTAGPGVGASAGVGAGGGFGLLGMRERVELTGGSLSAGPTRAGGWSVCARLPLPAPRTPSASV